MSAIVALDTETTGLSLDDDIWEIACIRREEDGIETEFHWLVEHNSLKCGRLPEPFQSDHQSRFDLDVAVTPHTAALTLQPIFADRPHIVGAVPNFDTERLALLGNRYGISYNWHYHLIDVENLAVGYLRAQGVTLELPWDSRELSKLVGVEEVGNHQAMADARWALALYDAVMGIA